MIHFSRLLFLVIFSYQLHAAVPRCAVVTSATPKFDRLTPQAKNFWLRIGKQFQEQMDADFKRPQNMSAVTAEIKRGHPYLQFLKSIGFDISSEAVRSPPLPVLLEKLLNKVDMLNTQLREKNFDVQIQPQLHLNLIDSAELKQSVILKPFAVFEGSDFSIDIKQSLLSDLAFTKKVSRGEFPVGGLGNASRISRAIMDRHNAPNITDFLHDLAHLEAFIRQPQYAIAFVRHYRSRYERWSHLNEMARDEFAQNYIKMGTPAWMRTFLFTEGAWIAKPGFQNLMSQWPQVSNIIVGSSGTITPKYVRESMTTVDHEVLRAELQSIADHWWHLMEPLGGATNDMISVYTFTSKSQMPIPAALEMLDRILKRQDVPLEPSTVALVLGILKYTPEMTLTKWEHFVRTPDKDDGALMNLFRKMFPEPVLERHSSEWSAMGNLLYKNFGKL